MEPHQDLFTVTNAVLTKLKPVLDKEKPGFILLQGDTTITFVTSLDAFYLKIRIGHVEAGLRGYDTSRPFPEEINRRLSKYLVDFHFAPTKRTKSDLFSEGIPGKNVFVTGNTIIDALFMTLENLGRNNSKLQHLNSQFSFLNSKPTKLILVTVHRRENFGNRLRNICLALKEIIKYNHNLEIIYSVHLNPNVQEPVKRILRIIHGIHLINALDYQSFVWLMEKSYFILTDSGEIQEEAPSLGRPVLVLREVTERAEAVGAGTVRVVGLDKDKIVREVQRLLDDEILCEKMFKAANSHGDGKVGKKIVEILRESL